MSQIYNIYCDESCHLEHDRQPVMVIGGVWCPATEVKNIARQIRVIKEMHQARGEIKWNRVSKSRRDFFIELVNFFFQTPSLHFRCVVVADKSKLNHAYFNQGSHDSFYYKMYFYMLRNILSRPNQYNIFLDIKDTRSARKLQTLKEILCNNILDFTQQMIDNIQNIHSHESEILQLADLLIGAVGYQHRNLVENTTKIEIINQITAHVGHNLRSSTPPWIEKFNLFVFSPAEVR